MKKQGRNLMAWLFLALGLVMVIYASYSEIRTILIIGVAILLAILIGNRLDDPRWNLNDRQRRREDQLKMPAVVAVATLLIFVTIGENGFESLSNSLQVGAAFAVLGAVLLGLAKSK
jgi:hypothetical protein